MNNQLGEIEAAPTWQNATMGTGFSGRAYSIKKNHVATIYFTDVTNTSAITTNGQLVASGFPKPTLNNLVFTIIDIGGYPMRVRIQDNGNVYTHYATARETSTREMYGQFTYPTTD